MARSMIDPGLFDELKSKMDEECKVKKDLSPIVDELDERVAYTQGMLSRMHSTPRAECEF